MFQKARLKLTAYYILIITFISILISSAFYYKANIVFNNEYKRIVNRVEHQRLMMPQAAQSPRFQLNEQDILAARRDFALQLIQINLLAITLTAVISYILAGITLQPIQKAMQKQKRFIADASHELKTPLTSLMTSIEVSLMDNNLTKPIKKLLTDNLDDIKDLHDLTNSLLTLSRLEDTKTSLEPTSLKEILESSIEKVEPQAKKHKIRLQLARLNKSVMVKANKASVTELFVNLLENAIKYSETQKTIRITTKVEKNTVAINVIDQGIGIKKEDIPHIFDRFYRIDRSRTRKSSNGYGLGLSLAKQIANNHQGSISVSSSPQKGSTFTVTLPRA